MNAADAQIADILARYEEPFAGNVWRVQGTAVIYHKALERIAATAKIRFDSPTVLRAERDEAVILVTGRIGVGAAERAEWSIGEALIGANYRVSGKQAAYVYAMAEKRAKDRVILKLIGLHGLVYSEEEADEFKDERPKGKPEPEATTPKAKAPPASEPASHIDPAHAKSAADIRKRIAQARTFNAVTDLMLHVDTQRALADLPDDLREEVRSYAKARLVDLGWPSKGKPKTLADQVGPMPDPKTPAPEVPIEKVKRDLLARIGRADTLWRVDELRQLSENDDKLDRLHREDPAGWEEVMEAMTKKRVALLPPDTDDDIPNFDARDGGAVAHPLEGVM